MDLLLSARQDRSGRAAAVIERLVEEVGNGRDVLLCGAEGGRREPDLLDEVVVLGGVQVHVFVHLAHVGVAAVGREARFAVLRAPERGAEVLVQVC